MRCGAPLQGTTPRACASVGGRGARQRRRVCCTCWARRRSMRCAPVARAAALLRSRWSRKRIAGGSRCCCGGASLSGARAQIRQLGECMHGGDEPSPRAPARCCCCCSLALGHLMQGRRVASALGTWHVTASQFLMCTHGGRRARAGPPPLLALALEPRNSSTARALSSTTRSSCRTLRPRRRPPAARLCHAR